MIDLSGCVFDSDFDSNNDSFDDADVGSCELLLSWPSDHNVEENYRHSEVGIL